MGAIMLSKFLSLRRELTRKTGMRAGLAALSVALFVPVAPASATSGPDHVSFTVAGCTRLATTTLPDGNGDFICPTSQYGTANLGDLWSELDLVPLRLTAVAGATAPPTQTYAEAVAVDGTSNGDPGYDVISAPQLNTVLSDFSCGQPTSGAQIVSGAARYRVLTITQAQGATCVYDYYARLALGSAQTSDASLYAYFGPQSGDFSAASKTVSIAAKEVVPQAVSKDMTATQDSDHGWNVTKSPTPTSVGVNTCDPNASHQAGVNVTVTWTKQPASPSGDITVHTHVYATNHAARTLKVDVSDQMYSGVTPVGAAATAGPVDLPANTVNHLVIDRTTTVPSGTTGLNDIATATYTDNVTGVSIPGTATGVASANVTASGVEHNASATINDVTSITGAGYQFSADSFTGASGGFDLGYVAGTPTSSAVSWTSASQPASGSVTFATTVYASEGASASGTLSDTATLNGSDGFTTDDDLPIGLSAACSDATAPTTTIALDPAAATGNNSWYVSAVHAAVSASDPDDSVAQTRCALDPASAPATIDAMSAGCAYLGPGADVGGDGQHVIYAASEDSAGNKETPVSRTFKIDRTPPVVSFSDCPSSPVVQGTSVTVHWTASDATSGLASPSSGGLSLDTSSAGVRSVGTPTATDNAGNTRSAVSCSYVVGYSILGFFSPAHNSKWKAGQTVPVKIALGDAAGNRIPDTEAAALASACRVTFSATGAQTLAAQCMRYEPSSRQFLYNWKIGTATGTETISAQVSYPPATTTTIKTDSIRITK